MKKKLLIFCLLAFCFIAGGFANTTALKADVVWTPRVDKFYETHKNDCVYVNLSYKTSGNLGYVIGYQDPEHLTMVEKLKNGCEYTVTYIYTDQVTKMKWGLISERRFICWVKMDQMVREYDSFQFYKEHREEMKELDDWFINQNITMKAVVWKYPNSKTINGEMVLKLGVNMRELYTDEKGREWTYLYYNQGLSGWICLNAPGLRDLSNVTAYDFILDTEPTSTVPAPSSDTPEPIPMPPLFSEFEVVNSWPQGFIGQFTITNKTNRTITKWKAEFSSKYEITSLWGAKTLNCEDGLVKVANEDWDAGIEPGQSRTISFVAQGDYQFTIWNFEAIPLD